MSPFSSSICQEVSDGHTSVLSTSSNLNSPTPQEQSENTVGADDEDGFKDGREEIVGGDDDVGIKEGKEEIVGGEDDVGLDETDGTADGTPRLGSHEISIFDGSKYASHRAYTLGLLLGLKNSV